jgi:hypothetical protein
VVAAYFSPGDSVFLLYSKKEDKGSIGWVSIASAVPPASTSDERMEELGPCGDNKMVANDQELKGTQERIAYFQNLLAQFRITTTPEEFPLMASGYRAEIERMHTEVMEYLMRTSATRITSKPVNFFGSKGCSEYPQW